jgi:hypothetical protein
VYVPRLFDEKKRGAYLSFSPEEVLLADFPVRVMFSEPHQTSFFLMISGPG